jgi:hypothetical protein
VALTPCPDADWSSYRLVKVSCPAIVSKLYSVEAEEGGWFFCLTCLAFFFWGLEGGASASEDLP